MGKVCRVKYRTKTTKKRKGFNGHKSTVNNNADIVNLNVPIDINTESSSVNNESQNNSVYSQSESETNINLSTASASSQKIKDFVASSPKDTSSATTGNRIIDILSNVISMLLCPECQCPTLSLGIELRKNKDCHHYYLLNVLIRVANLLMNFILQCHLVEVLTLTSEPPIPCVY